MYFSILKRPSLVHTPSMDHFADQIAGIVSDIMGIRGICCSASVQWVDKAIGFLREAVSNNNKQFANSMMNSAFWSMHAAYIIVFESFLEGDVLYNNPVYQTFNRLLDKIENLSVH